MNKMNMKSRLLKRGSIVLRVLGFTYIVTAVIAIIFFKHDAATGLIGSGIGLVGVGFYLKTQYDKKNKIDHSNKFNR